MSFHPRVGSCKRVVSSTMTEGKNGTGDDKWPMVVTSCLILM